MLGLGAFGWARKRQGWIGLSVEGVELRRGRSMMALVQVWDNKEAGDTEGGRIWGASTPVLHVPALRSGQPCSDLDGHAG